MPFRSEYTREAGVLADQLVANWPLDKARSDTSRLHPGSTPLIQAFRRFDKLFRSSFLELASGSITVSLPRLRLRVTLPVSHQLRASCQLKPASSRTVRMVSSLTSGKPSGALHSAWHKVFSDQVAAPSVSGSGFRQVSRIIRSRSAGPYLTAGPLPCRGSIAFKPSRLKRFTRLETASPDLRPDKRAAAV